MTRIEIFYSNSTKHDISHSFVKEIITTALHALNLQNQADVDVALVGELSMQKLNKFWRGRNKVTDVLSFSQFDDKKGAEKFVNPSDNVLRLGQIVICPSYVNKQARRVGNDNVEELKMALVHGLLHLLGYNHEDGGQEEDKMILLQEKILKLLKNHVG